MVRVAVLVDCSFFLKRYPKVFQGGQKHEPRRVAENLHRLMCLHANPDHTDASEVDLQRILVYDCKPCTSRVHHPVSGRFIDFGKTEIAGFRLDFHEELKRLRKVALRLGELHVNRQWVIRQAPFKRLLKKEIVVDDLVENDVAFDIKQKGVDIKIGLDIASLAHKRLVERIVLVSGDSDFVPAAKMARREGIDFILDPMWNPVKPSLLEHIDGLHSTCRKP